MFRRKNAVLILLFNLLLYYTILGLSAIITISFKSPFYNVWMMLM